MRDLFDLLFEIERFAESATTQSIQAKPLQTQRRIAHRNPEAEGGQNDLVFPVDHLDLLPQPLIRTL